MVKKAKKEHKLSQFKGKKLTDFIKLQLMKYFRYQKQYTFVCSECINYSDITALNSNSLIEIEIKISKSDFLKEFSNQSHNKKQKHKALKDGKKPYSTYILPNYYYFCTTPELAPYIKSYLQENGYTKYGILVCGEDRIFNTRSHIYSIYPAKKIHTNKPTNKVYDIISKRVQSELIGLKEKLI